MDKKTAGAKICPFITACSSSYTCAPAANIQCVTDQCMAWQHQDDKDNFKDCDKITDYGYCKRLDR